MCSPNAIPPPYTPLERHREGGWEAKQGLGWEGLGICLPQARVVRITQRDRPQEAKIRGMGPASPQVLILPHCQILAKYLPSLSQVFIFALRAPSPTHLP